MKKKDGGTRMEETISLKEIFEVIKKRFLLILAFILGAALIAAVISYFLLTPQYEASSQFIVNQKQQDSAVQFSVNDIRTNVELISTYNVIITNSAILDEVIETLNLEYSAGTLAKNIKVSSEQNSQVVKVSTTNPNPFTAADIVNTTVQIFQQKIPQIMDGADNVKILSEAKATSGQSPVSPNPMLNIAIGIVLGAMTGIGLAFLLEYLNNTITTEDDIDKYLGLPVLGVIATIDEHDIRKSQKAYQESHMRRGGFNVQTPEKTS